MRIATLNRRHIFLTSSALVIGLSASLAACSGEEEPSESPASGTSAAGGSGESGEGGDATSEKDGAAGLPEVRSCTVVVEVSGDAEASWKGKGDVRVRTDSESGPVARYTASKGDALVIVYSPDDAIDYPALTFSQGEQAFTSVEDDAADIEVESDGAGAEAQVELSGFEKATVDASVAFTCTADEPQDKSKGKSKGKNKGSSKDQAEGAAAS